MKCSLVLRFLKPALLFPVLALLVVARPADAQPPAHAEWQLTFSDEFDGQEMDWSKWESDEKIRNIEGRWPENNVVRGGVLRQLTKKEDPPRGGKEWSTAHIWTRDFTQQYGYFECRMKYGRFLNNAFWVYRPDGRFPEPPHFEIDVNEGHTPREVAMNLHFFYSLEKGGEDNERASFPQQWYAAGDLDQDYHVYAVEWDEAKLVYYFDGKPIYVLKNPNCHAPADVRLSTIIRPWQLEEGDVDIATMDGVSMDVDWVRCYQKVKDLYRPDLPEMKEYKVPTIEKRPSRVSDAGKRTELLCEGFSSKAGGLPEGLETGEGTPRMIADVTGEEEKHGQVLELEQDDYVFEMLEEPVAGRVEVEFDCLTPRSGAATLLFITLGEFDREDPKARKLSFYQGDIGTYIHWSASAINYHARGHWQIMATRRSESWVHVRLLMDLNQHVFDLYRDGEYINTGEFRNLQKAIHGIGLRYRGKTSEPVYVDNLVVRKIEN
ncbi:family 16 glycosylhydrolase [bacterium]|nr:family 16 glycosylhydrolase [bacterium]